MNATIESIKSPKPLVNGPRRGIMIQHHDHPFRHSTLEPYLSGPVYKRFCEEVADLVSTTSSTGFENYDARVYALGDRSQRILSLFMTKHFLEFVNTRYGSEYTKYVDSAIHFHGPGSRSGWRHNDFNFGHFAPTSAEGFSFSDNDVCDYRHGTMPKGGQPLRLVRSLACLFYFQNSWREGDGGETLVAMHERCEGCKHDKLVAPVDNRLLIFECSPSSFHAFRSTTKTRRSLIFWLHSSVDQVAKRWPISEVVPW